MQTRTIEIDFDVHKAIELERRSFSDTPNAVLRRKYGIGPAEPEEEPTPVSVIPIAEPAPSLTEGRPWVGKGRSTGLVLPHGTDLAIDYNGKRFAGRVENGGLVIEGEHFSSLSGAAVALCRTKDGRRTNLNGKELCQIRLPGATRFRSLKGYEQELRKKENAAR